MSVTEGGRRPELAAFLRSRRAALSPSEVGLPDGTRRRTPGLRREEVATLADVGVTWYTFLEQGRPIKMSADALERVGHALRLAPQEIRHLFLLADRTPPADTEEPGPVQEDVVPDALAALIAGLRESPAWLVTPRYDILAWNAAATAVWIDLDTIPPIDRNLLWLLLTDRRARAVQVDWERNAQQMVAAFRGRLAENKEDPTFAGLADRLHQASPEFRRWWPRQDVLYQRSIALETEHPEVGRLTFSATTLRPEVAPLLRLLVWTPADDTPTRARLRQIAAGR